MNFSEIKKDLETKLSSDRFEHTMGVCYTCASLAMKYGFDLDKAMTAGLLHDCARFLKTEDMLFDAQNKGIAITSVEKSNPILIHAKLGVYYAQKNYGITDIEILDSILYHTTGRIGMTLLDKIVFIADYIEPGRTRQPNLSEIRALAFTDIDLCLYRILEDTVSYLFANQKEMDQTTLSVYGFYKEKYGDTK